MRFRVSHDLIKKFFLRFTTIHKANWKENLTICHILIGALFQASLSFFRKFPVSFFILPLIIE